MLVPWLTLFDLRTAFSNFIETDKVQRTHKNDDFVILIPIFNDVKYLSNIDFLKKYSDKVILCTTDLETEKFYNDLEGIANKHGFKIIKSKFGDGTKNPWMIYQKTLLAHDYVLGESIKVLDAKYVIFLDADTTTYTDIPSLIGTMEQKDFDLSSVVVLPSKKDTVAENLQYIEYEVAMKSRRVYPWLTSGAAMIAKRESMIKIMQKHSLFFNGGDIEIGKIAHLSGLNVGHIEATFYTDVPETLYKLYKQRFSWFCGAFRHSVINAHTNFFSPMYSFYFTVIIFLMLPFKIYELFVHWYIFPFIFLFYVVLMFIINWEIRSPYMLIFPFYSLFQVLVMPLCGIYRYVRTVGKTRNFGFMKIHYKDNYHPVKYVRNISLLLLIGLAIFNIHLVEGKLMLSDIDLLSIIGIDFSERAARPVIYNGLKLSASLLGAFLFVYGFFKTIFHLKFHIRKRRTRKISGDLGMLTK